MKVSFFDFENWREIVATLSRNKTRTFLTAFGIFWGTAMLGMLWGGARGFEGIMRRNFDGFAPNTGVIMAGQRSISYRGFNRGSSWKMNELDLDNIRRMAPYIENLSEINTVSVSAAYNDRTKSAQLLGVNPEYASIYAPVIYSGRFINESDMHHSAKIVLIGKNVANELFGADDPVGKRITLSGISFTVAGVIGQTSDASVMGRLDDNFVTPSVTLRRAFNLGTDVGAVIFTSKPGHKPSDNLKYIRRAISVQHPVHPDDERAVELMDLSDMFEMIDNLFLGISLLALFVGIGSLMAGVIGVGNIMWIIVKERTHEFGVRRAIGAKPLDITVQVLSESVLLTLVAGTAGVCFAAIVLGVVDNVTFNPMMGYAGFQLPFVSAVIIVAAFFVLGSAAGTLPAVKAMRIKPIEALRDK